MDLCRNNYFLPSGHKKDFKIDFVRCQRQTKSFFEEMCVNCEMVWESRRGPLKVLFSGGMDSVFLFETLKHLGMPFTPVVMKINDDLNYEDVAVALSYCYDRGATPTIVNYDFIDHIESGGLYEMADNLHCSSPFIVPAIWLACQIDGCVLPGEIPTEIRYEPLLNDVYAYFPEYDISYIRGWEQYGLDGTPMILNYTAESLYSFLIDQNSLCLLDSDRSENDNANQKRLVYNNQDFFKIPFRLKQTGFEFFLKSYDQSILNSFHQLWEKYGGHFKIKHSELINILAPAN